MIQLFQRHSRNKKTTADAETIDARRVIYATGAIYRQPNRWACAAAAGVTAMHIAKWQAAIADRLAEWNELTALTTLTTHPFRSRSQPSVTDETSNTDVADVVEHVAECLANWKTQLLGADPVSRFAAGLEIQPCVGASLRNLSNRIETFGFSAVVGKRTEQTSASDLPDLPRPAILRISNRVGRPHFVTVVSNLNDQLLVADPAGPKLHWLPPKSVFQLWLGEFVLVSEMQP